MLKAGGLHINGVLLLLELHAWLGFACNWLGFATTKDGPDVLEDGFDAGLRFGKNIACCDLPGIIGDGFDAVLRSGKDIVFPDLLVIIGGTDEPAVLIEEQFQNVCTAKRLQCLRRAALGAEGRQPLIDGIVVGQSEKVDARIGGKKTQHIAELGLGEFIPLLGSVAQCCCLCRCGTWWWRCGRAGGLIVFFRCFF